MKDGVLRAVVCLTVASGALAGCVTGTVSDANTKSGLGDVSVFVVSGTCSGTGCPSGSGHDVTSSSGLWAFDPYGDLKGTDDEQLVSPASGQEALLLQFTKAGYRTTSLYHRPLYKNTPVGSKTYLVSTAQQVYMCPVGSPDSDGDGLCDAAEAAYGTDAHNPDTDGDGLNDYAETLGDTEVDLRYFGASPTHKDIFVYADYYVAPMQAALDDVTAAFAAAPLTNPDGKPGIAIHIVLGKQIAAADQNQNIIGPASGDWSKVDVIKNKYFPPRYARFMHYLLFGNRYDSGSSSGISRGIPAHDFLVTLGAWPTPYGTRIQQAGTLMHELGHNLGLMHGGNENRNNKPNYLSLMSYRYQVVGLFRDGVDGVLDYSRVQIGTVNEAALNELAGMPATGATTAADLGHYRAKFASGLALGTVNGPLDFNADGLFTFFFNVTADLDGNGLKNDVFIASQNDWKALLYQGNASGGGTIGGQSLPLAPSPDLPPIIAPLSPPLSLPPQLVRADQMDAELGPQ